MSIAYSWEAAEGVPAEIYKLFTESSDPRFGKLSLLMAIPEYKVPLEGGLRPSQNDVFALLACKENLIAITVEGKGREDFDETLEKWKERTSSRGYEMRLSQIVQNIGLDKNIPGSIRYQLLHRTASAVLEAKQFHAKYAAMIVQSFEKSDDLNHFSDYASFVSLYGKKASKGKLIKLKENIDGVSLFSGWVQSEVKERDFVCTDIAQRR